MIKPDFFDSESLSECSIEARLAFIGLWVMGDDYGRQKAQIRRLRTRIFPYDEMDDESFSMLLCELERVGCIKAYEIDGERYIYVPNFSVYQTVRKPSASSVPAPPKSVEKLLKTTLVQQWCATSAPLVPLERKKEVSKECLVLDKTRHSERVSAEAASSCADAAPLGWINA